MYHQLNIIMKNKLIIASLSIIFTGLVGCKKYLTTLPDNRIDVDQISDSQIKQLLTDAYPHRTYFSFAEALSDNAEDKGNPVSVTGDKDGYDINIQAFNYTDNTLEYNDDSPLGYFYECYRAIATANQALAFIKPADTVRLAPQVGEGLLCRAYAHFMLVTFFAKAYNPATASSDPGIPYITTVETDPFAKYDRKTVQYVYDMIEKDIIKALPLIRDDAYGNAPKFHFNQQAAYAFASRFYLFKRDYAKTIQMANSVLGGAPATILRDMRNYPTTYGAIQLRYTATTENANLLLQESFSNYGPNFYGYKFGMGEVIRSTVLGANITGQQLAWDTRTYGASPNFYNFPKFYNVNVTPANGHTANTITTFPLLCAEEVILNRIEANAMLKNYTAAVADINVWANKNTVTGTVALTPKNIVDFYDPSTTTTKDTTNSIVQTALYFKRVSYMSEGLRWLDVVRLNIPVTHKSVTGGTVVLPANDKRRLLQLPQEAINSGIALNPR